MARVVTMLRTVLTLSFVTAVLSEESLIVKPRPICKKNEVYELCPAKCPFRTCGIDDNLLDCIPGPTLGDPDCPPAECRCKPQFFRDNKGNCVPWEQCPKCSCNEVYDPCFSPCLAPGCNKDPRLIKCAPAPQIGEKGCVAGCRCKDGFMRNGTVCVRPEQCPNAKCKKRNEEYDLCPTNCPARTCGIDDNLVDCKPGPVVGDEDCPAPKCRCKQNFFRDDNGECVPWEKCPTCPGQNEEYDPCFSPCLAGRCDYDPTTVKCAPPPTLGDPGCVAGCRCKDGYVRNGTNVCVLPEECPNAKCKKRNEEYDLCPTNCPARTCGIDDTLADCMPGPVVGDPDCPEPKCRCKQNYFRDDKGECVPWEQCPTCPPNEKYSPCGSPCSTDRCDFDPRVVRCMMAPTLGDEACVAGCRCEAEFLRNDKGICIPRNECPCGGDPNAQFGCGGFCTRCSNYKKGPALCTMACQLFGCDCRKGFIYDEIIKKCVRPGNCTIEKTTTTTTTTEAPVCVD